MAVDRVGHDKTTRHLKTVVGTTTSEHWPGQAGGQRLSTRQARASSLGPDLLSRALGHVAGGQGRPWIRVQRGLPVTQYTEEKQCHAGRF